MSLCVFAKAFDQADRALTELYERELLPKKSCFASTSSENVCAVPAPTFFLSNGHGSEMTMAYTLRFKDSIDSRIFFIAFFSN